MPRDFSGSGILPVTTTYYGHTLLALPAKVRYTNITSSKVHYCTVSIIRRYFNNETNLVQEQVYATVPAWIGDNNTVHLMEPLAGETETDIDMKIFFEVSPEQEDQDEQTRTYILNGQS